MSCYWNIKINEGKCIFSFWNKYLRRPVANFAGLLQIRFHDGGRWQRRRQWTVSSSCPTSATITFLCRESSGAVFLLSGNYISHFSKTLFLHRSKPHLQRACCPELSLLKYIWSRVNCGQRIVFDVVCKLSPLDHISPSGTLDITRPPAGRQQLFTLSPFFGSFICVFWY